MSRSFVDVLFILLCSTITMLIDRVYVAELDTAPARVGSGGTSPLVARDVLIVSVDTTTVTLAPREGHEQDTPVIFDDASALTRFLPPASGVLIVPAQEGISHQRVLSVWSELRDAGVQVGLGVEPKRESAS